MMLMYDDHNRSYTVLSVHKILYISNLTEENGMNMFFFLVKTDAIHVFGTGKCDFTFCITLKMIILVKWSVWLPS